MKVSSVTLAAFIGLTLASPLPVEQRQVSDESDDLLNGPCQDVTFIFARGSTEPGNMVRSYRNDLGHGSKY